MPKVMTGPDFNALDLAEQGYKIRDGFTIVDVKPPPKPRPTLFGKSMYRSDFDQLENADRWAKIKDGYVVVD